MKNILTLFAFLAVTLAMNAQLVSVDVVPYELQDPASIQPEGTTTYRVYANMLNPTDEIIALFGLDCSPLEISTSTSFYNASIGSVLGSEVNPSLFGVFPEIEADSWLTLGIDNLNADGASQLGYLSSIGIPFDDSFSVENGVPLLVEDGAVYIVPEAAATGIGPENSILLGQFTTDGTLTFKLNLQVFIEGDNEQVINYMWNPECLSDGSDADGSMLGLIFDNTFCNDPLACNYAEDVDPEDVDNSTCNFESCYGCTDPAFCNYQEGLTYDDGSCSNDCPGCTDPLAENYDEIATVDDGSCFYLGCTDILASNFDPEAGVDDGSCMYSGCMDPSAYNYFILATEDDGSCSYECTDETVVVTMTDVLGLAWLEGYYLITDSDGAFVASGTLASAAEGDGMSFGINEVCLAPGTYFIQGFNLLLQDLQTLQIECLGADIFIDLIPVEFEVGEGVSCNLGCTDEEADNYDPEATFDFGCIYSGCTDPLATNYNPQATEDDGSCLIGVSGYVFYDANVNGVFDSEFDYGLPNYAILLEPTNQTIFTDENGYYELLELENGSYTLSVEANDQFPTFTTSESQGFEINGIGFPPISFGLTNEDAIQEIAITSFSFFEGVPCSGATDFVFMSVENMGNTPLSGNAVLTYDPAYGGFETWGDTPDLTDGNTLTWNFGDLAPGSSFTITIGLIGPSVDFIGETIINTYTATAFEGEDVVAYGEFIDEDIVTCAYDPNDKAAEPEGYAEPNFILNDTEIRYRIRFQNTGNAPATDVLLRDTLDVNLDLSTFQFEESTHDVVTTLDWDTREVTFLFENINLPDSTTSFDESIGAVFYSIQPLEELPAGTEITNTAHIFFDLNPAIVTNTVFHTIYECGAEANFIAPEEICLGETITAEATAPYIETWNWLFDGEIIGTEQLLEFVPNDNAEYTLSLVATNPLCETETSLPVTVWNIPNANFTQDGVFLTATSGQAWQWFLNGAAIEGANEVEYTVLEDGTYSVEITNTVGCSGLSDGVFVMATGVSNLSGIQATFYPNPVTSASTLQLSHSGPWNIALYNAQGKLVENLENMNSTTWRIANDQLAPGIYHLQITSPDDFLPIVIDVIIR